jgi:AcrR family transcriptional regulator
MNNLATQPSQAAISTERHPVKMRGLKDYRKILLNAAARLFAQEGFHAVGIDRILAEAGVAKMTLYNYFPSKTELTIAVLEERRELSANSLALFIQKFDTPLERLHGVFMWYDRWFHSPQFTGCIFAAAAAEFHGSENSIIPIATSQKKDLTNLIKELLVPLTGKTIATQLGRDVVMLLDGAILAAHVAGRKNAAKEAWRVAQEIVRMELSTS